MADTEPVTLAPADWAAISSPYLAWGRKAEAWEIVSIEISGKRLSAVVRMTSTYLSETDGGQFHLSFITCQEFLSQLMIIYGHVWADQTEKTREGWVLESSTRNVRAIRDPEHIQVEMEVVSIRRVGIPVIAIAKFEVADRLGGLCTARLKAIVP